MTVDTQIEERITENIDRYMEVLERENTPAELRITMDQLTYVAQLCDCATGIILMCPNGERLLSAAGSTILSALEALNVMCKLDSV